MGEEHKTEILNVETILDSCVLAEGKRWYQVKWKPLWMTEQKLPCGILETYRKGKAIHDENDGIFRISEESRLEDGVVEYLLCRGNTWESEDKLNSIDENIVYSYWSHQSDLKEIVKVEEDFGDYGSRHHVSDDIVEDVVDESSLNDPETYRISMAMHHNDYIPVPYIKTEVDDDISVDNIGENEDDESTMTSDENNDYQCAKCNSMFISGKMSGKEFLSNNENTKGYTQCMKCGEMYCPRCSVNMGELRHNGKTSLFCDSCIENFANQTVTENIKVKNTNRKPLKPNITHVGHTKPVFSGFPCGNYIPKDFCCEICGKCFNTNTHTKEHEIIVTGENSFQCSECFKKVAQQSHVNNQEMGANNRFQYFMPMAFQPVTMSDGNKQLNGFKKPGTQHITEQGITVLSGKHKSHVVHKDIHFDKNMHNMKNDGNDKGPTNQDPNVPNTPNDGYTNYYDEDDINIHQDDEALDGKEQALGNYKCYDCGRSFNRQYTLDTHQRIHTGEKPYVCEICGARFRQSGTKLNHVRAVHTKERPFQCQYCGKTFSHKSSITVHIRIHTKEKPYQCKTCERCFTDRATYLKHQSIHSGVKPYHCPMCTRKFSQKSNLKRHYKNIHELGKPDTSADLASGSGDGGMMTDVSDRSESAISAAMSKINSMPEYPPMPEYPHVSERLIMSDVHTKVELDNRIKVVDEDIVNVMPDTTITVLPEPPQCTVTEVMPVCSV